MYPYYRYFSIYPDIFLNSKLKMPSGDQDLKLNLLFLVLQLRLHSFDPEYKSKSKETTLLKKML